MEFQELMSLLVINGYIHKDHFQCFHVEYKLATGQLSVLSVQAQY